MSYREVHQAIDKMKRLAEHMENHDDPKGSLLEIAADSSYNNKENKENNENKENKIYSNPYFQKKLESQVTQLKFKIEVCKHENNSLNERFKKSEQDNNSIIQLFENLVAAYSTDLSEENLQVKIIEEFLRERGIKTDDPISQVRDAPKDQYKELAGIFFSSGRNADNAASADSSSTVPVGGTGRLGSSSSGRFRGRGRGGSDIAADSFATSGQIMSNEGVSAGILESNKKLPGYMNCKSLVSFFRFFTQTY